MGVNSHQMSIVWCLTRKGMKNLEDQTDDEMGDQIVTKWAYHRIDDEMGDRIDDRMGCFHHQMMVLWCLTRKKVVLDVFVLLE